MQLTETYVVIDEILVLNVRSVTSSFKTNCVFNVYRLARVIELNILILVTEVSYSLFSSFHVKKKKIQTSQPPFCQISSIPCCSFCSLVVESSAP